MNIDDLTIGQCITCGNSACRQDADGWCRAHGWDCADFHMYLDDGSLVLD